MPDTIASGCVSLDDRHRALFFVALHRRGGGDAGEDFIHARPVHAGGAFGDGGAVRGVIELRSEGGGDEAVHGDVLAGGEVAGLAGERFGKFDVERHGAGIIGASSRGGKTWDAPCSCLCWSLKACV